jgi:hypothetical protein
MEVVRPESNTNRAVTARIIAGTRGQKFKTASSSYDNKSGRVIGQHYL